MEKWDAYDIHMQKTGELLTRGQPIPKGRYHLVIHAWFVNDRGDILLQRRSLEKPLAPGLWSCLCGSALSGETPEQAVIRETQEEMGFTPDMDRAVCMLRLVADGNHLFVYRIPYQGVAEKLTLQQEEVMDAKWFTREQVEALCDQSEVFWRFKYSPLMLTLLSQNLI